MNATKKRTVVITGSSSGIGHACVARMVQSGWHVVATVRKPEDGSRLKSKFGASLSAVMMDVTDRATVTAAAEEVLSQLQGGGLDGLVNVAGVGMMRPVEYATLDDLQQIFDINVFGQIAVTQAFLPMIRSARGRIVNISSVGAHVAIPFGSPINASKSAFSRFSETLRLELHPFGVHVCEVEPGAIRTPAVEKTLGNVEAIIADLPARGAAQYGEMLKGFARRAYAREMNGSAPDVVAGAVHHALTAHRPRSRYLVGKHAKLLGTLPRILPRRLLEALLLRIAGLPTRFGAVPATDDRGVYQRAA
jgi:NAD(P)-dependent dehydrogenase (short-subunit alcohol dehydrogenase family)